MAHYLTGTPKKLSPPRKHPILSLTSLTNPTSGYRAVQSNVRPDLHLSGRSKQDEDQSFHSGRRDSRQLSLADGEYGHPDTNQLFQSQKVPEDCHSSQAIQMLNNDSQRDWCLFSSNTRQNTSRLSQSLGQTRDSSRHDYSEFTHSCGIVGKPDVCKMLQSQEDPADQDVTGTFHFPEFQDEPGTGQLLHPHDKEHKTYVRGQHIMMEQETHRDFGKTSSSQMTCTNLDVPSKRESQGGLLADSETARHTYTSPWDTLTLEDLKTSALDSSKMGEADITSWGKSGKRRNIQRERRSKLCSVCDGQCEGQQRSLSRSSLFSRLHMPQESLTNFPDEVKMAILPHQFRQRQKLCSSLPRNVDHTVCGSGIHGYQRLVVDAGRWAGQKPDRLSQSLYSRRYLADQGEITCPDDCYVLHDKLQTKPKDEKEWRNRKKKSGDCAVGSTHRAVGSTHRAVGSTHRAIRLIQLLYRGDPETRHNSIITARWFHQWRCNVQYMKIEREKLAKDLNLADSQFRRTALKRYFAVWKCKVRQSSRLCEALTLHEEHLLRKGMKGFTWAVIQARRQTDMARQHLSYWVMRRIFMKWVKLYQKRKQEKLQSWLAIWRKKSDLQTRCEAFITCHEKILIRRSLNSWRERVKERVKTELACRHYKQALVFRVLRHWRIHCAKVKVKQLHQSLARIAYDDNVKRRMFTKWAYHLRQSQRSRDYHRRRVLRPYWEVWCKAYPLCKAIRQRVISTARQHRRVAVLKSYFNKWILVLRERVAGHIANQYRLRRAWCVWLFVKDRRCNERRLQYLSIICAAFVKWRAHTKLCQQRCQKGATVLQQSLLRRTFTQWRTYSTMKKDMRLKMVVFENQVKIIEMRLTFVHWWHRLAECRDKQFAFIYWSNRCVRKAATTWQSVVRQKKLEKLEQEMNTKVNSNMIRASFAQWLREKQKSEAEKALVERVRQELKHHRKHRLFTEWRILTHQSQTVRPLVTRVKRRQLACVIEGWKGILTRKKCCRRHLKRRQQQMLTRYFLSWRVKFLLAVQIRQCAVLQSTAVVYKCFSWWRAQLRGRQQCTIFRHKTLLSHYFVVWKWMTKTKLRQQQDTKVAEDLYWKRETFAVLRCYTALRMRKRELSTLAENVYSTNLKKQVFRDWLCRLQERALVKPSCLTVHQWRVSSVCGWFSHLNTGQSMQRKLQMATLHRCWRLWKDHLEQASIAERFHRSKLLKRFFFLWCLRLKEREDQMRTADQLRIHTSMKTMFVKWKLRFSVCMENHKLLPDFTHVRNVHTLAAMWRTWVRALQLKKAEKKQNRMLMKRMFSCWTTATKVRIDQIMRSRALCRAVNERTVKLVFTHWRQRLFMARLGPTYHHTKLMKRAFNNWITLVKHTGCLKRLLSLFISTRQTTTLWRSFMFWKDSVQRNQAAAEFRHLGIFREKSRLKKAAWVAWKQRSVECSAGKHYKHMLVTRYFRKWQGRLRENSGS